MAPFRRRLAAGISVEALAVISALTGQRFGDLVDQVGTDQVEVELAEASEAERIVGGDIDPRCLEEAGVERGGDDIAIGSKDRAATRVAVEQAAEERVTRLHALFDDQRGVDRTDIVLHLDVVIIDRQREIRDLPGRQYQANSIGVAGLRLQREIAPAKRRTSVGRTGDDMAI